MSYQSTWDDLFTWLSIIITIEEGLHIQITDEEASTIETIQDLVDTVKKKLDGKKEAS